MIEKLNGHKRRGRYKGDCYISVLFCFNLLLLNLCIMFKGTLLQSFYIIIVQLFTITLVLKLLLAFSKYLECNMN